jgi:small-conductance mechanosensitive channel
MAEGKGKMKMIVKTVDAVFEDDKENFISKYLTPVASCICCNTAGFSYKINEAYLSGFDYRQIIETFAAEAKRKTGRNLDTKTLTEHFTNHFNYQGAAIAEYNRQKGSLNLPEKEKKQITDIFQIAVSNRINDIELLDLAMKEQIKRLKELEDIKKDRVTQNRAFDLEHLIMKQETIMNNLQTHVLGKLKIWQKAQFQSKQIEYMDKSMQFLDQKTANWLGIDVGLDLDPKLAKQAERLYLKTVLENIVQRINMAMDISLHVSAQQKAEYFKEFKRQCNGIEENINEQYKHVLSNLKEIRTVDMPVDEDEIAEEKAEEDE